MKTGEIDSFGVFDAAERYYGAATTATREIPDSELASVA